MDTARARDELGWVPEHGSQATLAETVDAARAGGTVQ
jgi:nucleoside-diphosphate-sugar epimerase